ncbi:hypothetical protein PENCOP_c013G07251 [Penicillium coprophilum]|uniref:Terpene synthase n=1 Tax=Penicillium coprophilum TaxID=36646 RepID=A0A1V6UA10_9EURO|nr:hypothetical protein PENCOP_c013G07251 [Penicillium coprophilum]
MDPNFAESKLAYHGLQLKSNDADGTGVDTGMAQTDQIKALIRTFLEEIGFDRSIAVIKDHEMRIAVWQHFKNLGLGEKTEKSVQQTLDPSVNFAKMGYTSLPFQDFQAFGQRFALNQHHKQPLLAGLDCHLRNLSEYFGPYCHSVIVKGMLDFINGRVIEHKIRQSGFKFSSDSRLTPMLLRTKVGGGEIMVYFLYPNSVFPEEEYLMQYFPISLELVLFIDFTNDILSYYKEFCLADETGNFVANFADTHHVQHLDVLRYLTSYVPDVTKSTYRQVQNSPSLLALIKNFTQGMIMLFTAHRRYQLVELFADEQYLLPYEMNA